MEKTLKNIVIGGLYLIPFILLLVTSSLFFPYITGKNFAFRIITEIVFFAWIALAILNKEYRPKWNWLLGSVAIFVGIIFLADIFGQYPFKSFWSNFERMEGWVTLIHLLAYFTVLFSSLNRKLWDRFLDTWLVSAGLVSIYALFQLLGFIPIRQGGTRVDGPFGNAAYMAIFVVISIFLALFRMVQVRHKSWRVAYGILALTDVLILYHTATRGAILGFLGALILGGILIFFFEKENKALRKVAGASLLGVIVLVSGFWMLKDSAFVRQSPVLNRFATISLEETTTKSRFLIWNMALQGFKEKPVLGWGQENFNYVFNKYYDPQMYNQEQWFDRTHNVFFDWLVAGGLLGLLSYLSIFFFALYYLWRKTDFSIIEKSIITSLFSAYFFHNLFVFDNIGSYLLFFTLLAYIAHHSPSRPFWKGEYDSGTTARLTVPFLAVVLIFTLYFVNIKGILQAETLIDSLSRGETVKLDDNLKSFKKAIAYGSFGTAEVREHLTQTTQTIRSSNAPAEIKRDFFELTYSELQKQIEEKPGDARYYVFLGSFLNQFGKSEEALPYLEKAVELSPNKQAILFALGSSYLILEQTDKAVEIFEKAYTLAPEYAEAKNLYGVALIYDGQVDKARELLASDSGSWPVDQRLAKVLFDVGRHEEALGVAKKLVEERPNDVQGYISLAAIYVELGQDEKAIETIDKAIQVEPRFRAQGEYYIKEIESN